MISSNMNGLKGFVLTGWTLFLCLQKAPIDPFTKERCKPSASQGVPLGGMGCVPLCLCLCFSELTHYGGVCLDISRLFLQEWKHFKGFQGWVQELAHHTWSMREFARHGEPVLCNTSILSYCLLAHCFWSTVCLYETHVRNACWSLNMYEHLSAIDAQGLP